MKLQGLLHWTCRTVLAVLALGGTSFAQAQMTSAFKAEDADEAFRVDEKSSDEEKLCKVMKRAPALLFKSNPVCLSGGGCHIPAYIHDPSVPFFPNLNAYTTLVELTLPDGDFLVTAKLSAFPNGGAAWFIFECALSNKAGPDIDYSSFDGTYQQTLFFQTPVSFKTGSGGTMMVGCKSTGYKDHWGGDQNVDMLVWSVNIAAIRVGTVTNKTCAGGICRTVNVCGVYGPCEICVDGKCVTNAPHYNDACEPSCGEADRLCGVAGLCNITGGQCIPVSTWDCTSCCTGP